MGRARRGPLHVFLWLGGLRCAAALAATSGSRRRAPAPPKEHKDQNPIEKQLVSLIFGEEAVQRTKFYHLHIPRTAGTSFIGDFQKVVVGQNLSIGFTSKEGCYNWKNRLPGITDTISFVREPRAHVLSMFYFCSQSLFHGFTQVHHFKPWIKEWTEIQARGEIKGDYASRSHADRQLQLQKFVTSTFLPFHCYDPANLQVQHYTCRGSPFNYTGKTDGEQAIQNMKETFFVGIVEAYKESMCVLHAKVNNQLPYYCNCENRFAWDSFNMTHKTYTPKKERATVADMKPETLQMVDSLTTADRALYKAAVARFALELHDVERRFKTKILCQHNLATDTSEDGLSSNFAFYLKEAQTQLRRPA